MTALGLHLMPNGVSAVELERAKDTPVLLNASSRTFPHVYLDPSDSRSLAPYVDSLKEFLYDGRFRAKEVICSLPQSEVFVRAIEIPPMNDKDLASFIKFEAGQYIPMPLEDVTLGYDRMPVEVSDKDKARVLLVAAKKKTVEFYINVVKLAQLTPIAMEPESLAMARSLGFEHSPGLAELIITISGNETYIILSYRSYVVLTRTVPVGERHMLHTLQQIFDLDPDQAVVYKNTYGLDRSKVDGKVYEALKPLFNRIIAEIQRSRTFFLAHNPKVRVDKIIVSGETALMPGLLVYFVDALGMEVVLADPWMRISLERLKTRQDVLRQNGPLYSVSAGLALRGVLKND